MPQKEHSRLAKFVLWNCKRGGGGVKAITRTASSVKNAIPNNSY